MMARSRLRPSSSRLYWLALALVVKGLFFCWYLTQTYKHDIDGFWGQSNGDMMTYIQPVEELLLHHGFKTDDRMPGYSGVYLAFRLLFSPAVACNIIIVLQLLLAVVSVYALGLVARDLFQSERAFYWAYFIYLFSPFASVFDGYFLTESFAASVSIFFLYAWIRFEQNPDRRLPLLVAGAWLTWSVFLKPAHLPLLAIPVAVWTIRWLRGRLVFRQLARYSFTFLLPFLIVDGAWMVRNYRQYGEVIPLLKNPWYANTFWPTNYFDMVAFCQTYGEDFAFWFPNTDLRWLMGWGNNRYLPPLRWYVDEQLGPPPAYVYTSKFNRDSMIQIRELYFELGNNPNIDSLRKQMLESQVRAKLGRYTRSVREDNPLVYYVWSPVRYLFTFLHGTWGYSFLDDMIPAHWPRLLLRLYHYALVLIPGLIGLVLLLRRGWRKNDILLFLPMALGYCVFVYAFALRHAETRYLVPFYPFLVLSAVSVFTAIRSRRPTQQPSLYDLSFRHSADL
ncbi:hypothetical protein GGR92_004768 [Spirosoma lacussanchae]|uniref:hypothetical protein n=1 Tax=Spirosoma lacussanchae TaxID=1884249 RepID=UPI0011083A9C|nr:hypothetical protein [Spirosoma lacussanchae]